MKKLVERLKDKLATYKKEKVTVMFVPHDQRTVKNYNISYLRLITILFGVFFVFTFSIITVGRYAYYVIHEKIYTVEHKRVIQEMSSIINNSGKLIEAQEKFDKTLNQLLSISGLKSAMNLKVGVGGPLVDPQEVIEGNKITTDDKNRLTKMQEIDGLLEISQNSQEVKNKIKKLSNKIKSYEAVTRYIPSIWPLLGDGEIKSSKNGVMEILTLAFTPVVATAEGKVAGVVFTQKGAKLTLIHRYQFVSVYNGLYQVSPTVKINSTIRKGDVIGYVAKNQGQSVLSYGLFVGNEKGLYPLDPRDFSYLGR